MYLWDAAAKDFYKKFTSSEDTPSVLLVTTVNPKTLSGEPVKNDKEVSYILCHPWLGLNTEIAKKVKAEEVTKTEVMTIGQIIAYSKTEDAKEASFFCVATVDDVVRDRPWYYIACSGCQTKATRGPSSLMCAKCGKNNISGVPKFLARINVYDNNDQAVFVLLGDAGKELTGKTSAQLVDNYFEVNEAVGDDHQVPVPQVLLDTIGKTQRFKIKVSELNLTGKVQALTVTKIVSPDALPPLPAPTEVLSNGEDGVPLPTASVVAASQVEGDDVDENVGNVGEAPEAKRPRHDK
ncbi:hypothetical protein N665_0435s0008 [Sinapis alba]|nr:hypothetical protein N665_0435s0008 [Sinapis alba]